MTVLWGSTSMTAIGLLVWTLSPAFSTKRVFDFHTFVRYTCPNDE